MQETIVMVRTGLAGKVIPTYAQHSVKAKLTNGIIVLIRSLKELLMNLQLSQHKNQILKLTLSYISTNT